MPTIDELSAATAAANSDVLPVSQNGIARKATRAQLVAGLQPSLALPKGHLLGRSAAGVGAPEAVALGANLSLSDGTLSAAATVLDVAALPHAGPPNGGDLVPLGQSG